MEALEIKLSIKSDDYINLNSQETIIPTLSDIVFGGVGVQTEPAFKAGSNQRKESMPGKTACSFELERKGINYKIEIVDNTEKNKRFNIMVTNLDDPKDKDYLSIAQITMFYDELQDYLTHSLKIYLDDKNKISYLALTDKKKVFVAKGKKRGKTLPRNIYKIEDDTRFDSD